MNTVENVCWVHGNVHGAGCCAVGSQNRASAYSDMFHIENRENSSVIGALCQSCIIMKRKRETLFLGR